LLNTGPAKKVTVYVIEGQTYHGTATYAAILDYLFFRGIADATVTRGIAGFGTDHKLHASRLLDLADQMPIKIEFVESPDKVQEVLPKLTEIASQGLIEVHDTTVIRPTPAGKKKEPEVPAVKLEAKAKMMRILIGEHDQWNGKPLHEALVQALRANDIAGVTVYRGILGYGANRRIHKDSTLNLSHDAPILLTVVDAEQKLRAFFPVLDQMVKQGLVVLSDVDVIKYSHAQPLSPPQRARRRSAGDAAAESREAQK
jgi:PII-like signaling protein